MANRGIRGSGGRIAAVIRGLRCVLSMFCMLYMLCVATPAFAQAPRDLPLNLINARDSLAADQTEMIAKYAEYWTSQLANPAEDVASESLVFDAAAKLIEPAANNSATPIFRLAYSRAALPKLEAAVRDGEPFNATQAMRIVAQLGTNEALNFAIDRLSPEREPRFGVRTWASKAVEIMVRNSAGDESFRNQQLANILRRVGDAAKLETEWNILIHEFGAMAAAKSTAAREQQIALFQHKVEQLGNAEEPPSAGMVNALSQAMISFRQQFIELSSLMNEQTKFGHNLAPSLVEFHENVVVPHWEAVQQDEAIRITLERAISINETLLLLVHNTVRRTADAPAPADALEPAWKANNQPQFQTALGSWTGIVTQPPYR